MLIEVMPTVASDFVQTMELLKTSTGLDIESLIQRYSGSGDTAGGAPTTDHALPSAVLPERDVRPSAD